MWIHWPWETLRIWFPNLDIKLVKITEIRHLLREWNSKINRSQKGYRSTRNQTSRSLFNDYQFFCLCPRLVFLMSERWRTTGIPFNLLSRHFTLMDSIEKSYGSRDMVKQLNLTNTEGQTGTGGGTAQEKTYDFVIGRAEPPARLFSLVQDKIAKGAKHSPANGILYLKGRLYRRVKVLCFIPQNMNGWTSPRCRAWGKVLIHFKIPRP